MGTDERGMAEMMANAQFLVAENEDHQIVAPVGSQLLSFLDKTARGR